MAGSVKLKLEGSEAMRLILIGVAMLVTVAGCHSSTTQSGPAPSFDSRLTAAQQIDDLGARDRALAKICTDATNANDAQAAGVSARQIDDLGLRDKMTE